MHSARPAWMSAVSAPPEVAYAEAHTWVSGRTPAKAAGAGAGPCGGDGEGQAAA